MENAVKALLIAAAVIIAVLLISLVMGIFNTGSEQANKGDLTEYEVQKFNADFLRYEGNNVSGSEVNAMIKTVFNHNLAQEDSSTCVAVNVDEGEEVNTVINASIEPSTNPGHSPDNVVPTNKYKVFCILDKDSNLVTNIIVKKN